MLERVLVEFGEQLGFKGLALNNLGTTEVEIEGDDRLELQRLERELLVCYIVPHSFLERPALLQDLLLLPHPDNLHPFPVQVGSVADGYVVLIARLQLEGLGADQVMAAFEYLWELKQSLFY